MTPSLIVEQDDFEEFCSHIREAGIVAFDTEFVSEHTYHPQLCLLQFATAERVAAVDPEVRDLAAWWELMVDSHPNHGRRSRRTGGSAVLPALCRPGSGNSSMCNSPRG